ncbi:hypothetical protein PVAND_006569 [Polypedilum vanderplanki]|uniref:Mitochondrial ribosomal protein S34 n=1 Tax=Polypedilum vanderplanki TaxID=319348 RepID=A0A9J6C4I3_POLVA|nr:hypothetical protein PVAND_006569 [Polypedilum vanderplanki]
MSVIKYIGRTTDFKGNSLWEICGNLKNLGVGRVVVRSRFERYPEKSFFRILQVETLPNQENRKIKVVAEKVFRGKKYANPVVIESASYKTDYRLLSKKEENDYCQILCDQKDNVKIIEPEMEFPPLLKEFLIKETGNKDIKMKVHLKKGHNKNHRLALEGEKADIKIPIDIGKPISPSLYEGLNMS